MSARQHASTRSLTDSLSGTARGLCRPNTFRMSSTPKGLESEAAESHDPTGKHRQPWEMDGMSVNVKMTTETEREMRTRLVRCIS